MAVAYAVALMRTSLSQPRPGRCLKVALATALALGRSGRQSGVLAVVVAGAVYAAVVLARRAVPDELYDFVRRRGPAT